MSGTLSIPRPDDYGVSFDLVGDPGEDTARATGRVVTQTAWIFRRALVMAPPDRAIVSRDAAFVEYLRICRSIGYNPLNHLLETKMRDGHYYFQPLTTVSITPQTDPTKIREWRKDHWIAAGQLWPPGTRHDRTTKDRADLAKVLTAMMEAGLPLCLQASGGDFLQLERIHRMTEAFPDLVIVLSSVTTAAEVEFVQSHRNVGATMTVHHLLASLGDQSRWEIEPWLRGSVAEADQAVLLKAATSGNPHFFLGTGSQPRWKDSLDPGNQQRVFSAPAAIPILVEIFEIAGALEDLNGLIAFSSRNGARWFGTEVTEGRERTQRIDLIQDEWVVSDSLPHEMHSERSKLAPLLAGQCLRWRVPSTSWNLTRQW